MLCWAKSHTQQMLPMIFRVRAKQEIHTIALWKSRRMIQILLFWIQKTL